MINLNTMDMTSSRTNGTVPGAGDQGFSLTNAAIGEVQPTMQIAQASNPHPLQPGAWVYGVATGPMVPPGWSGGVFITSPSGNPLNFSEENGNSIFVSKNVTTGRINPATAFGRGGVGTYNPVTNQLELGYGGTIKVNIAGTPVIGFLNARANPPENFTGSISANFGIAASVDQAAAGALSGMAGLAAAIPTPQTAGAAAGLAKASAILRGIGQAANGYAGIGYRVELRFNEGNLQGIYYQGRPIVDIEAFMQDALKGNERYKPPVIPNNGVPEIANLNYTNQLIFGTSPWDLAATSDGLNNGNPSVAVANDWRGAIQSYGMRYLQQLPDDARRTVLLGGPRSMSEAGAAVNAILAVASPDDATAIASRLANRYDLDFGVPLVKAFNEVQNGLSQRPGDYQFVRNVFQGNYRDPLDNPAPRPNSGGFRL